MAFLTAVPTSTSAAGLSLDCGRADVMNPAWNAPLKFVFEGDDQGTLKVSGPLGEFSIPVKRSPMEIQPGEKGEAIDGNAKATLKLPALADLEACIDKEGGLGTGPQSDEYLNARDACLRKLKPAASGVGAIAEIRLGISPDKDNSGEDAFVVFKLRYEAPSRAPGGQMTVEAFPAQCRLGK